MADNRNAKVAMAFFIATELMFFAGLISAWWVLRGQTGEWPPAGQPRFPILVTGMNTLILLLSGAAMLQTRRALKAGCHLCLLGSLGLTVLGGFIFLVVQGYEWSRLIAFGLQTAHNIYAGTFYYIVGAHFLHVVAALIVLFIVILQAARHRYSEENQTGLLLCRMYWLFVVLLWPVLYAIVYLL